MNTLTVKAAMVHFYNSIIAGGSKPISAKNRVNQLKRFVDLYGNCEVSALTRFEIDAYVVTLQSEGLSNATYRAYVKSLKQFFSWCKDVGISENIARHVSPPKQRYATHIKAISANDFTELLKHAHHIRDKAILAFMGDTGARPVEVCNLRLEHLHLRDQYAYVFGKTRTIDDPWLVDYSATTANLIGQYLLERPDVKYPQVFLKMRNPHEPINYNTLRMLFQRRAREAGVETNNTPKAVRHLVGQRFTNEKNLELARQKLGHEDIKTTRIYANVDRSFVKEATEELSLVDQLLE